MRFLTCLLPFESQQTFLEDVCGDTCQSSRVVCGNAHSVDLVGSVPIREREQRAVLDLVEETFVARF